MVSLTIYLKGKTWVTSLSSKLQNGFRKRNRSFSTAAATANELPPPKILLVILTSLDLLFALTLGLLPANSNHSILLLIYSLSLLRPKLA